MSKNIPLQLTRWFEANARDLPWRINPEPYFVWLSEVMLQQTQVVTVLPYFDRFTKKFPTVTALANASLDDVYSLWAGLGYYSRARNLHQGAKEIQKRIEAGLGFPQNREQWLEIPGVGEYTAGAICSIVFNQREALVDGNVVRVLSRIYAIGKIDSAKSQIWTQAKVLVNTRSVQPRNINQALMELGALVCKPKNPQCEQCPVSKICQGKNRLDLYPPPKPKRIWKKVEEEKWVMTHSNQIFLIQTEKNKWRQGLWDFPNPLQGKVSRAKFLGEETTQYVVTNHKVRRKHSIFEVSLVSVRSLKGQWFDINQLPGVPAPVKKFLKNKFLRENPVQNRMK